MTKLLLCIAVALLLSLPVAMFTGPIIAAWVGVGIMAIFRSMHFY